MTSSNTNIFNEVADFLFYEIGANPIPADTKYKRINKHWGDFQDKSVPVEVHEFRKEKGEYDNGIAVMTGRFHKGKNKGKFLIGIDCDNKKAIEEICNTLGFKNINELAGWTWVEQHKDNADKAHIYILSTKPFKNKGRSVDNTRLELLNEIPAIEVKCERQTMFTAPSIHEDGYPYEILGTREPVLCDEFENHLDNISRKYNIEYLDNHGHTNNNNSLPQPLRQLINWLEIPPNFQFKIHEGSRHNTLISFANALLFKYKFDTNVSRKDELRNFFYDVNNKLCVPEPLPDEEIKNIWRDSLKNSEEKTSRIKIENEDENDASSYKSQVIIPLDYDDQLLETVETFVYDIQKNSVDCSLNSKYKLGTRVIVPINIKQWPDVRKNFKKECIEKGIDEIDISLLLESLDKNIDLITKHYLENHRKNVAALAAAKERKRQRLDLIKEGTEFVISKYNFRTIMESKEILKYDSNSGVYVPYGDIIIEEEIDKKYGYQLKTNEINEIKKYVQRKTYTKLEAFDANLDIINLEDGLFNWRTKEFLPHKPDYYSLNQKPIKYNPEAIPRRFIKFLREVLHLRDIRTVVEIIAYTFIRTHWFQYYYILKGEGGNGKNVLIGILSHLHGEKNVSNVPLKDISKDRFALVDLVNKDINVDTESTIIDDISSLKKLTDPQLVRVQQKGQPAFDARLHAKPIFAANKLPTTADNTDARFRREIIIDFPNQFQDGINADPDLLNKIVNNEEEMSGIFNLVVNSLSTITKNNKIHINAATISQRRAKAKLIQDTIGSFLDDALAKEATDKDFETSDDMHAAFMRFCLYHQISGPGYDKFLEDLNEKYKKKYDLEKGRKKTPEGKKTIWKRCKLVKWKNPDDPTQSTLDEDDEDEEYYESENEEQEPESPEEKYKREQEEMKRWG
ncbi:MAG TPA: phage/plasmid primase, P4 family [Nitrososphaeraceae archaeon]|nr:phage/plasmid primase, P4 family [Nitrososphaeraceae archaeon]